MIFVYNSIVVSSGSTVVGLTGLLLQLLVTGRLRLFQHIQKTV